MTRTVDMSNQAIPVDVEELARLREDAARMDYLQSHLYGVDFEYGVPAASVMLFRLPRDVRIGADIRKTIDDARQQPREKAK